MKTVRQHITRVVFFNASLSLVSLVLGAAWAAVWYLLLYVVAGMDYPLRYDLQNPTPWIACAIGVFSGSVWSCWIGLKYSCDLYSSYVSRLFDKDAYEVDFSEGNSGSNFARRWKAERMYWAGTLPDALRVRLAFDFSALFFIFVWFLQILIYSYFDFGFGTDGEFVSK